MTVPVINITNSQPVAVDPYNYMRADMENAPLGEKLLLINLGGVLVTGTLSESSRHDYLEWQKVPQRAKKNPVKEYRPKVDTA